MTTQTQAQAQLQRISFSLYLDGQRATAPVDCLGGVMVGPHGLLNILETQLGLLACHPSAAERVIQYRDCLQALDSPLRFYHRSFALDPLGTAAQLLAWRDDWALCSQAGGTWAGSLPADAPARLRDLAEVESLADCKVAPNQAQRLAQVLVALAVRKPAIQSVNLLEPLELMPARWQAVLSALPLSSSEGRGHADALERQGGFLAQLQHRLAQVANGEKTETLPWQDDGSVLVVQAETLALAANWLGRYVGSPDTLIVSGDEGVRLDAHLSAIGHARQGFKEASPFRPALQVLPLVTALLWAPLDYHAMVQFLTHPICPLPRFARQRLAEKMAEAPGLGGAKWQAVLADIASHYGSGRATTVAAQIEYWIDFTRFNPDEGAPVVIVAERVEQLVEFFQSRLGDVDEERRQAFISGYEQCRAALDALNALRGQGVTTIRPRQLQKLVAQVTGPGAVNPLWSAQVGAVQLTTQPGAAVEPVSRVIWWQLCLPTLPGPLPWSGAEVQALSAAGVSLPQPDALLTQAARAWLRPVMAAREQLILVLPPPGEELHPLWQMIAAIVDTPSVSTLEDLLCAGGEGMSPLAPVTLPAPKRWWQLPDDMTVPLRARESFSSLEQLLFNPYQWLLRYPAALQPSHLLSPGNDFLLFGNLAHELAERCFRHDPALAMSDDDFVLWFAMAFETLIDEEGALLRAPGRGADLARLRARLLRALQGLRQHLREAGATRILPEHALAGHFEGGELAGFADILLEGASGQLAIIDMKWSGAKKYPEKLRKNRHLQLAVYAELVRQQTGRVPSVAYYLLDNARLLAPDDRSFPHAECIASDNDENTAQLWQRFLVSWRWRCAQIKAGRFELVFDGLEATDDSIPPDEAISPETLNPGYNDYRALAGWKD